MGVGFLFDKLILSIHFKESLISLAKIYFLVIGRLFGVVDKFFFCLTSS